MCCLEQILEETSHKPATVLPPTSRTIQVKRQDTAGEVRMSEYDLQLRSPTRVDTGSSLKVLLEVMDYRDRWRESGNSVLSVGLDDNDHHHFTSTRTISQI